MERRHGYGYKREIYERAADRVPRDGRQIETEKRVEKENITIVMTTHDPNLMELGDVVYEMEDGELHVESKKEE